MILLIGVLAAVLLPHIEAVVARTELIATNCYCPAIYAPVCGSNAITYSSECILNCNSKDRVDKGLSAITVLQPGECPIIKCNCPSYYNYICGSDSNTYYSDCYFDCYNAVRKSLKLLPISIAYRQPCEQRPTCTPEIYPVCGTDNRSYRNYCYLRIASLDNQLQGLGPIYIKSYGACLYDSCICPTNLDPVCGSDGFEYSNPCTFECQRRRLDQLGQTPIIINNKGPCCVCAKIYDPVCGSDGNSYANPCLLECASKLLVSQGKPAIKVASKGVCSCFCTAVYDPVCGSDEKTYSNGCELGCANKIRQLQGLSLLTQLYKGVCLTCNCPLTKNPVCGTDGKTYMNACFLGCENQRLAKLGLPPYYYYNGPCPCKCNCTWTNQLVCGTDQRTYYNLCYLNCASNCNIQSGGTAIYFYKNGYC